MTLMLYIYKGKISLQLCFIPKIYIMLVKSFDGHFSLSPILMLCF